MRMILLCLMIPMLTSATDKLSALAMIETGNNDYMVGRAGEISRYQILKAEWHSVTNRSAYTDPRTAKAVAVLLLEKRVQSFQCNFGRPPTDFEIYGLWNAPGQVMQHRVTRRVAERCRRFANLCESFRVPVQTASLNRKATTVAL